MTVKLLTKEQKDMIIACFNKKTHNQTELAGIYGVSKRTIGRVIVEAGLATTIPRLKGEAYRVMKLLEKHQLDYNGLEAVLNKQPSLFATPLNHETVQEFLNARSQEDLAKMFYQAALIKVAQMYNVQTQTAMLKLEQQVDAGRINGAGAQI